MDSLSDRKIDKKMHVTEGLTGKAGKLMSRMCISAKTYL
jgi:hypothetical protein